MFRARERQSGIDSIDTTRRCRRVRCSCCPCHQASAAPCLLSPQQRHPASATAPPPSTAECEHPQWSSGLPVWLTGDRRLCSARTPPLSAIDTRPGNPPLCGPPEPQPPWLHRSFSRPARRRAGRQSEGPQLRSRTIGGEYQQPVVGKPGEVLSDDTLGGADDSGYVASGSSEVRRDVRMRLRPLRARRRRPLGQRCKSRRRGERQRTQHAVTAVAAWEELLAKQTGSAGAKTRGCGQGVVLAGLLGGPGVDGAEREEDRGGDADGSKCGSRQDEPSLVGSMSRSDGCSRERVPKRQRIQSPRARFTSLT